MVSGTTPLITDYFPSAPNLAAPRLSAATTTTTATPLDALTQSLSSITIRSRLSSRIPLPPPPRSSSASLPFTIAKMDRPRSPKMGSGSNQSIRTDTKSNSRITKRGVLVHQARGMTGRVKVGTRKRTVSGNTGKISLGSGRGEF